MNILWPPSGFSLCASKIAESSTHKRPPLVKMRYNTDRVLQAGERIADRKEDCRQERGLGGWHTVREEATPQREAGEGGGGGTKALGKTRAVKDSHYCIPT